MANIYVHITKTCKSVVCSDVNIYNLHQNCAREIQDILHVCTKFVIGQGNFVNESNGYQRLFPGGKKAGAWSWPLTSI